MRSNILDDHPGFEIYLLIGTNLGQRERNIKNAEDLLEEKAGRILEKSLIYETQAWGIEDQPSFLNRVIKFHTYGGPWEILNTIEKIEAEMGRERKEKWGERLIDIDILYFEEVVMNAFDLIIPHPEIQNRRFTLVPLVELAPELLHPQLNMNQSELLEKCPDRLEVKVFQK